MKLADCNLDDFDEVWSSPQEKDEVEADWIEPQNRGELPPNLFIFYRATNYLSLSRIAGFATQDQRLVSAYFARVVRGLKECLVESAELAVEVTEQGRKAYSPKKRVTGQDWDRRASYKQRSAFRLLMIDLCGALDSLAEITELLLPGSVPSLSAGRSSFSSMYTWLTKPIAARQGIVVPTIHFAEQLHQRLSPLVVPPAGPERQWFELLWLLRNKAAHLGHQAWQNVGLQSNSGEIGIFIPKAWPFVPEEHAAYGTQIPEPVQPVSFKSYFEECLVHSDITEFSSSALEKVKSVVDLAFEVFLAAFRLGSVAAVSETARRLRASSPHLAFEYFEAGAS